MGLGPLLRNVIWYIIVYFLLCITFVVRLYGFSEDGTDNRRIESAVINDEIDLKLGFERYRDPQEKLGWLVNLHSVGLFLSHLCAEAYVAKTNMEPAHKYKDPA